MTGPSQWCKAVVPKHFTVPYRTQPPPTTLKTVKLSGYVTNRRHHAPSPCADIQPTTRLQPVRRYFSWARKPPGYGPPRPTGPGAAAPAAPTSYAPALNIQHVETTT